MCGKTNEEVTAEYAKMLQRCPDALTDEEKRRAFYDEISVLSLRLLDNLGIDINVSDLPTWTAYRFYSRRKYGGNWLSQSGCRLFPRQKVAQGRVYGRRS
jgi:hypothetical protein